MLTIFEWFGYDVPLVERFKMIKNAGFDGVLLWWAETSEAGPGYRLHPDIARREGLFIENIHAPYDDANDLWIDGINGEEAEKRLLSIVRDCRENEIPAVVVHPSCGGTAPPNEIGLNRFKRLAEAAERCSVDIALENLRRVEFLEYIFARVDSPRLGFCFDSGHWRCRTPGEDLLSLHGRRLKALHLHDNAGYITGASGEDEHKLPFDGSIDWSALMKKIRDTGYTGATSIELGKIYDAQEDGPEGFLRKASNRAAVLERMRAK